MMKEQVFEDNLAAVEDLLSQSVKGFHFAFDRDDIKLALGSPINGISDFTMENTEQVQEIFFEFVKKKTLQDKQDFLNGLTIIDRELIIKTYFNILENTLKKCMFEVH